MVPGFPCIKSWFMVPWKRSSLPLYQGTRTFAYWISVPTWRQARSKWLEWNSGGLSTTTRVRHAIAFPGVPDGRKLTRYVNLGKNRVFNTYGQALRRFEPHVKAHWAAGVLVERQVMISSPSGNMVLSSTTMRSLGVWSIDTR